MAKSSKNFETAMQELEQIVKALEGGEVALDQALALFKQGMDLSQFCNQELQKAQETVQEMLVQANSQGNKA